MIGKGGVPIVRMEAIFSLDLWICAFQFGLLGVMNDLNIVEVSNHFHSIITGNFLPIIPSYTIEGQKFDWVYYLTDGIYSSSELFVKTASDFITKKQKVFCSLQECVRTWVKRVFGVLFRIVKSSCTSQTSSEKWKNALARYKRHLSPQYDGRRK